MSTTVKCLTKLVSKIQSLYFAIHISDPPVDGGWSDWTQWTPCDAHCGAGSRQRSRVCNNPPPANGGKDCIGEDNESVDCTGKDCDCKSLSK